MESGQEERFALHRRVRAFIRASAGGGGAGESFETLALAVAAYQANRVPAYARLLAARGTHPREVTDVRQLPAVPTDAFRFARIAAHPPEEDRVVFRTSGTTAAARGEHPLSSTETYEEAALTWGRWALFFDDAQPVAVVLGARPEDGGESSLEFMMRLFVERFAVRADYVQETRIAPIDRGDVERACDGAARTGAPVILMGTSFAFVHALDVLAGARFALAPGSRAMHTGGFKGKSREVSPDVLRSAIAGAFGLETGSVVGEYGMTELSSQLYEGTLRALRGAPVVAARHGAFMPPPWLRVVPPRGCSLAVEELLGR